MSLEKFLSPETIRELQRLGMKEFIKRRAFDFNSSLSLRLFYELGINAITDLQYELALQQAYSVRISAKVATQTHQKCILNYAFKCMGQGAWKWKDGEGPDKYYNASPGKYAFEQNKAVKERFNGIIFPTNNIAVRPVMRSIVRELVWFSDELEKWVVKHSIKSKPKEERCRESSMKFIQNCLNSTGGKTGNEDVDWDLLGT